ncbi:hypothetical protein [Allonocardiopsis opalescens]|uniref:Uncharacterized protein n=1 Tax=Allonocardiopsis opalescens TaxID=1144618 RepID=A0A2T0QAS3_9ACTN|nr:hypothetical protein [Allonocardiopsis opalescens]PRY00943.1 hypothetical protein CLV72_102576 [Allonocardiopsis opalescens]
MREAAHRLRRYVGGVPHLAEVTVRGEPAGRDRVTVDPDALGWRRAVYGPGAAIGGAEDERWAAEARAGAAYALRRSADGRAPLAVTVVRIYGTYADTGPGDIEFAAAVAVAELLGTGWGASPPVLGAHGAVFPE